MNFQLEQGCCAWMGLGPGKSSERRISQKVICPAGMRSLWKFAAFRPPASIQILEGGRALRCFQNELHHRRIINEKWYQIATEM